MILLGNGGLWVGLDRFPTLNCFQEKSSFYEADLVVWLETLQF